MHTASLKLSWLVNRFLFTAVVALHVVDALPECKPSDFHFEFTECDRDGSRWRVSVPKNGNLCDVTKDGQFPNSYMPIRLPGCSSACEAGFYFDPVKLACEVCPAGTYSLGGGVSFRSFDTLPGGFHISQDSAMRSSFRELGSPNGNLTFNCSLYGWHPRGDFMASLGGPCTSLLTYPVKLIKPGQLYYSYQYTDEAMLFQFMVQNDQCQSVEETGMHKVLSMTKEGEWKDVIVPLRAGLNVLHWKTIGMNLDPEHRSKLILLRNIEIHGVAYASTCSPCPNGTFSTEGAKVCEECQENTYSLKQSASCKKCKDNEFASKGSDTCYLRPPCSKRDYYEVPTPCNENRKMQVVYKWIEPKICHDDLPESVKLPSPGKKKPCPPCNPGMQYTNASVCSFCPANYYSDGHGSCKPCKPRTAPNYHHNYTSWNSWPQNMSSSCMTFDDVGCRYQEGWQIAGNHIHTGKGHSEGSFLVLSLDVAGFRSNGGILGGRPIEIAKISFEFDLRCVSLCELSFLQGSSSQGVYVIQTWNGTQPRQKFSYVITQNDSYTFRWIFQKVTWDQPLVMEATNNQKYANDEAKIYSIYLSNTIDGGAEMCMPCHQGVSQDGCIPCQPGYYVHPNTTACTKCPRNTYVSDPFAYGINSCQPCGPGLKSVDGQTCFSDCKLHLNDTHYDFTNLKGFHIVKGTHLFTTSGTQYYHLFNISLCGENIIGKTICSNNVSNHFSGSERDKILSILCRSTIVPPKLADDIALTTQSVSLGDHFLGVTTAPTLDNIKVPHEFLTLKDDNQIGKVPQIHFYYASPVATRACSDGRSSTITLRCDSAQGGNGSVQLPHKCPDGTCDGCSFHFLWLTKNACPTCTEKDYEIVKGECISGEQVVHYIPPKNCLLPSWVNHPSNTVHKCTLIPKELQIVITVAAIFALLLLMLVIYFWKKNRKLEYKYMKLVHSSNTKEGELPPAESCALDNEEEDHFDSIQFKESKSKLLMNKIRLMTGTKKDSDNPFETIQLTDKENL